MKKTRLTAETLDRFESFVNIDMLTDEQIRKIELDAYCANMQSRGSTREEEQESAWSWFVHLVNDIDRMGLDLKP